MEGLFVVVAIFVGLLNFAAKQQQNQNRGNMRRLQSYGRQGLDQWKRHIAKQPEKLAPKPEPSADYEGIELENRMTTGSMDYIEQSRSSEGECDEHPEHRRRKEKKAAPMAETVEAEEEQVFELTGDSLLKSVVMAEILGPPRAIKRRIR